MKDSAVREMHAVDKLARATLSSEAHSRWLSIGTGHRFMAYDKKVLIVYKLDDKLQPKITHKLQCYSMRASNDTGVESCWADTYKDGRSAEAVRVFHHAPQEICPGVFVGHTVFSGVDYVEHHPDQFGLRFSMYYKSLFHPKDRVAGACYILEKAVFDTTFGG